MEQADTAEIQVPTFISGIISKITGVDFCMDGAKYLIHSMHGQARLKPANKQVDAQLAKAAGRRIRITVAGYPSFGPECSHLSVYYAAPSTDLQKALAVKGWS